MPENTSVPPDDPKPNPAESDPEADLQQAFEAADLPEEERKRVEETLQRESPPDPEEVLAGEAEDEVLGAAGPEDALVQDAPDTEDPEELDTVLAEGAAASDAEPAVESNEAGEGDIPQDLLDELVADAGGSDEAAASEPDALPGDESSEPTVPQDVLDSLLAEVEQEPAEKAPKPAKRKPVQAPEPVAAPVSRSRSLRLIASLVAGLFGAMVVFYVLSANRLRPLTEADLRPALIRNELEAALDEAQRLMDDARYGDAAVRLQDALELAPDGPLRVDAEFLYLEAVFETLPESIPPETAAGYHSAVDRLVDLAPLHPKAPMALLFNARVYEAEGNPLAARALYRDILEDYPDAENGDEVLLAAGRLELNLERPVTASDYFDRLIAEYPQSPLVERARLHTGDALQLAGNYDGARVTFVRLAQANPGTALGDEAFERLGRLAYETGDYESAIRELETRLSMSTSIEGNDRIYLLLAKTHAAAGEPEKALELLRELIDFFPESASMPYAYIELSRVLSLMGRDREATRTATQAVDRYPNHPAVLRNAGEMLSRAGQHGAAAAAFEQAYEVGEPDPALLLAAGERFGEAELYADARRVLDRLQLEHATAPEALEGSLVWSELQFEQGELTAAIERLESLAEISRDRSQELRVKSLLADLYERIGFTDEAARLHASIPDLTSEPKLLADAALALFEAGRLEEGLGVADRVAVERLADKDAYRFLVEKGNALMAGDLRQALDTLETAHEVYPLQRTPEGDALLLRANLAAGRTARARAVMTDMRLRFEDDPDAAPALLRAAIEWGDFLYERRDYRAAADAYSYAMMTSGPDVTSEEIWALYQRANALYKMADFEDSLRLYRQVAESSSPWAAEAATKIEAVKLDMKLRGIPAPPPGEAG